MIAIAGCISGGIDTADENGDLDDDESPTEEQADDDSTGDESSDEPAEAADEEDAPDADAAPDDEESDTETDRAAEDTEVDAETPEGDLEVHAIDVGQADATLIVSPEETMLIDSGDWRDDGETVIEYLEIQGIERIDYLVTTHPHADHIGGHAAVIDHYETEHDGVGQVWDPGVTHTSATYENYLDAVEEHDVDLIRAQEGDEIPFEDVDVTLFNPPSESDSEEFHYNSTAVHVEHGDRAFLFTGDAEADAERRMLEEYGNELSADVYHAGHHGSSTSSSEAFLDAVDPRASIVSSGYESQYGHPHDEVLERFDEHGIDTYWTAVHGMIVFESDGETIRVYTQTDATTDPATIREAPESDADVSDSIGERDALDRLIAPPTPAAVALEAITATQAGRSTDTVTGLASGSGVAA